MTVLPGRNGRRRRVLNEEVLTASATHVAMRAYHDEEALPERPRYSEAAGVEHHPQITDYIPRRFRSIALLSSCGLIAIGATVALHALASPFAQSAEVSQTAPFARTVIERLADWATSTVAVVAAVVCWIIFFLRRHRIDDIRGRYRVWFQAALACLVISLACVAPLHIALSRAMAQLTGWSALREGAAWWLALAGVPMIWVAIRAMVDAKDCRLASTCLVASAVSFSIALAAYLGWLLPDDSQYDSTVVLGARMAGFWMLFVGLIANARFVVLDAQGLIPVRVPRRSQVAASESDNGQFVRTTPTIARTRSSNSSPSAIESRETEWVDGSRPEVDEFASDDERHAGRKMGKVDRKRQRKLKDQLRAA